MGSVARKCGECSLRYEGKCVKLKVCFMTGIVIPSPFCRICAFNGKDVKCDACYWLDNDTPSVFCQKGCQVDEHTIVIHDEACSNCLANSTCLKQKLEKDFKTTEIAAGKIDGREAYTKEEWEAKRKKAMRPLP